MGIHLADGTIGRVKVVVVDDSAPVRARLAALIREIDGVEAVDEEQDAEAAVSLVLAGRPELVILDLHLPGGGGIRALRRIKSTPTAPTVVILTNDPGDFNRCQCLARGADFFFDKAREFDRVLDVVSEMHRRAADEGRS
jgi:DNA-binding NarL/FixJ family response regulator